MSPRDNDFKWKISRDLKEDEKDGSDSGLKSLQDPEFSGWDLYATEYEDTQHVRVHPILHWSELDIWEYTKLRGLMFNPMYISKNGKRFRSLGCMPCTNPVNSNASNIDEIIEELKTTQEEERSGRENTKEELMEQLRALGYM
jgi:sulfate adenylyltransferase subunit 2